MKLKAINRFTDEVIIINDYFDFQDFFKDNNLTAFDFYKLTGFKDCKGNDIYEGDILSDWTETDEGLVQIKCTVFWSEWKGQWSLDFSTKQDGSFFRPLYEELKCFNYEIQP